MTSESQISTRLGRGYLSGMVLCCVSSILGGCVCARVLTVFLGGHATNPGLQEFHAKASRQKGSFTWTQRSPEKPVSGRTPRGVAPGAWGGRPTQHRLTRALSAAAGAAWGLEEAGRGCCAAPECPLHLRTQARHPFLGAGAQPDGSRFSGFPGRSWRPQDSRPTFWPYTAPGFSHTSCRDHQPQIQSSAEHHPSEGPVQKQDPQNGKGPARRPQHREPLTPHQVCCSGSAHPRVLGNRGREATTHEPPQGQPLVPQ